MVVGETHSLVAARKNMLSFSLAKHHICSRPQFWCSLCDSRSRSHSLALSLSLFVPIAFEQGLHFCC